MHRGSSLPAALAALIAASAGAQGTGTTTGTSTPGTTTSTTTVSTTTRAPGKCEERSCIFLGPTLGANAINIGWNTSPGNWAMLPGLRAGYWLPDSFVAGEAGLNLQGAPALGFGQLTLKL